MIGAGWRELEVLLGEAGMGLVDLLRQLVLSVGCLHGELIDPIAEAITQIMKLRNELLQVLGESAW